MSEFVCSSFGEGWVVRLGLVYQKAILLKPVFRLLLFSTYPKSDFLEVFLSYLIQVFTDFLNGDHKENVIKNISLIKCAKYAYEQNFFFVQLDLIISLLYTSSRSFNIYSENTNVISCYCYSSVSHLSNRICCSPSSGRKLIFSSLSCAVVMC